jgi:hypothetical protein
MVGRALARIVTTLELGTASPRVNAWTGLDDGGAYGGGIVSPNPDYPRQAAAQGNSRAALDRADHSGHSRDRRPNGSPHGHARGRGGWTVEGPWGLTRRSDDLLGRNCRCIVDQGDHDRPIPIVAAMVASRSVRAPWMTVDRAVHRNGIVTGWLAKGSRRTVG